MNFTEEHHFMTHWHIFAFLQGFSSIIRKQNSPSVYQLPLICRFISSENRGLQVESLAVPVLVPNPGQDRQDHPLHFLHPPPEPILMHMATKDSSGPTADVLKEAYDKEYRRRQSRVDFMFRQKNFRMSIFHHFPLKCHLVWFFAAESLTKLIAFSKAFQLEDS